MLVGVCARAAVAVVGVVCLCRGWCVETSHVLTSWIEKDVFTRWTVVVVKVWQYGSGSDVCTGMVLKLWHCWWWSEVGIRVACDRLC